MDEVLAMIPELDKLEDEVDRLSDPLAFKAKGPDQWAFCLAADYADEWTCVRRPDGSIKTALRSCHIRISGGSEHWCCTVTESKAWLRLYQTEGWAAYQRWSLRATGQRWACSLRSTRRPAWSIGSVRVEGLQVDGNRGEARGRKLPKRSSST